MPLPTDGHTGALMPGCARYYCSALPQRGDVGGGVLRGVQGVLGSRERYELCREKRTLE